MEKNNEARKHADIQQGRVGQHLLREHGEGVALPEGLEGFSRRGLGEALKNGRAPAGVDHLVGESSMQ